MPVTACTRKRPVRKPWPDDIERERVVIEAPTSCACCGGSRLAKLGEDVTETLEEIPRRFKLIETVRENFTCCDCEKISQPPAPFHAKPRCFIGPQLLATILFDKFGMHIPLNCQSVRFKAERIDLPLSTLADQVGHGTFAVMPLFQLIERHVLAAERLRGDDTTIRILAKSKCTTGRIRAYVRDDRPYGGPAPPAAVYYASSDRRGEHPQKHLAAFAGILQADCYSGFEPLSIRKRKRCRSRQHSASPMRGGASSSWPISRRTPGKAGKPVSPIALEAVRRLDTLFEIHQRPQCRRAGAPGEKQAAARRHARLAAAGARNPLALLRGPEAHELHAQALGRLCPLPRRWQDLPQQQRRRKSVARHRHRRNWTFAGSLRGADRAAIMLTMITTCRLNDVDPKAWLADVLARIADLPALRLHELLPWEWKLLRQADKPTDQQAA
ncbi:IS66 family transposase [Bradyrhizobium nanningense]|uniref:IS66 family transposase n=1 Tax=Bradyrhizobium nanningense TaxID=1325118 RepID=UPI001FE135F6|nr:IS66 family transposase [Bradyrhizobium nanningense]